MKIKMMTPYLVMALSAISLSAKTAGNLNLRVEADKPILKAAETQRAIIKVSVMPEPVATATERNPVNLAIVVDRSGSMQGTKIEQARQAAIEAVQRLGRSDIISIISYADQARTDVAATSVSENAPIIRAIQNIQANGNTALYAGVNQGAAELRKHLEEGGYFNRIILLSDGLANSGPSTPADLKRLGRALAREGVSVSTIGIGNDYNEDLMAGLAQTGDGNTYFVENYRDLPRIFQDELGDVLNVAAHQVEIEIRCQEGIVPLRVIGREASIRGNRVNLDIQQLYGEQEKYVLLEVEVPAASSGEERALVDVDVHYTDFSNQQRYTAHGDLTVRYSSDDTEITDHANVEVAEAYAKNEVAVALEAAIELADAGNTEAAAERMQAAQSTLLSVNSTYSSAAIGAQADWAEDQAKEIQQHGMDKRGRKLYRAKSYQVSNQQKE